MASTMRRTRAGAKDSSMMIRMDAKGKDCIVRAAHHRGISVSGYVRNVVVAQARLELEGAERSVIAMTPEEQLLFWKALKSAPDLTPSQKALGKVMQGRE